MLIKILVFIAALLIGSFLNVVIHRLPRRESLLWPASHCPQCGHRLTARDLIPLASYLWLGGRCRHCGGPIRLRYPLIELMTAVGFLLVYLKWGAGWQTVAGWVFTSFLITAAFIDIENGIIPDRLTYPGMLAGLALSIFTIGIKSSLIGWLVYGSFLLVTALISRGGMGGGDVKMAAAIGAFLGFPASLLALFLSSLLGGIWAAALLIGKKATRKTAIKFGPFLSLGAWLVLICGQQLINLYLSLY
ncbi:MAG TPA: prepilin peptidase [Syntrophomonadaceae bacterium]|nr:prepilin peptidase [Syntrophomonadaceae bacterium]